MPNVGVGCLVVGCWLACEKKISINKNKQIYFSLFLYYFYLLIFYFKYKKKESSVPISRVLYLVYGSRHTERSIIYLDLKLP